MSMLRLFGQSAVIRGRRPMDRFIHRQNLAHYQRQLAETTDEAQRRSLEKLIAEEVAKERTPPEGG
jgi:hypothetical protein